MILKRTQAASGEFGVRQKCRFPNNWILDYWGFTVVVSEDYNVPLKFEVLGLKYKVFPELASYALHVQRAAVMF